MVMESQHFSETENVKKNAPAHRFVIPPTAHLLETEIQANPLQRQFNGLYGTCCDGISPVMGSHMMGSVTRWDLSLNGICHLTGPHLIGSVT